MTSHIKDAVHIPIMFIFFKGANSYGQLGQGNKEDLLCPKELLNLNLNTATVTGGGGHTLILAGILNTLYSWVCFKT